MRSLFLCKRTIVLVIVGFFIILLWGSRVRFASAQSESAPAMPPLGGIVAIAAEATGTTCGLTETGGVECWGESVTTGAQNILKIRDAVALAGGGQHSCVVTRAGGVQCWGYNSDGQLGDGTTNSSFDTAVDVKGLSGKTTMLTAGFDFTCAFNSGEVWCWGANGYGQLGDGTTAGHRQPVKVSALTGEIISISAGNTHACALSKSGNVQCWGGNIGEMVGNGNVDTPSVPVQVGGLGNGVTMISSKLDHTCALTNTGAVFCWGLNDSGQLGNGETSFASDSPVQVNGLPGNVNAITTGVRHTCALMSDGKIFCWGDNRAGQLGDGSNIDRLAPVAVKGLSGIPSAITAGQDYTCAIVAGAVQCWGENKFGQLGTGVDPDSNVPVSVTGLTGAATIYAGGETSCALMVDGSARCWGENNQGQVGDATDIDRDTPAAVSGLPGKISELAVGSAHSCALVSNVVWCWGASYSGQLANEAVSGMSLSPVRANGLPPGVQKIAAGEWSTCALAGDAGLWCWGSNAGGQLGDGTTENRAIPVKVNGLTGRVSSFTVGVDYACAVIDDRAVCWGKNDNGQLGDGTTEDRLVPVAVSGLGSGVAAVFAGEHHTCAITVSGGVKCWGDNTNGQLGDGTTGRRLTPVDVSGLSGRAAIISLGLNFTCARLESGGVQCWGQNSKVGNDQVVHGHSSEPVDVPGLTGDVSSIASGRFHTCVVVNDGTAQCWGTNWSGQLGNALGPDSPTPLAVVLGQRREQQTQTGGFRPAGPLVPQITTYIPTPLDISTQPGVIGTNLLLAALMMLPFAVAAEFFTRTISEHEEALRRRVKPVDWISRLKQRMDTLAGARLNRHPALIDTLKLLGVMLFYGLIFSLLDRTWNPFSLKGLILFLSMTIAYGIVGVADDIMQYRAIRKWGLPAELNLRPTNVLIAMLSTATTRIFTLVPGLMFGTPEALQADESLFDQDKRNRLLKISALTFSVVGLGIWLTTALTGLIQRQSLGETLGNLLAGLEGFLLIIFAVALENSFVQMLGFAGSFGQALKRKNRWLWLVVLVGVTFLFYHTLLNPRGELVAALQEGNVRIFLGVAAAFVLGTFVLRMVYRRQERRAAGLAEAAHTSVVSPPAPEVPPAVAPPAEPIVTRNEPQVLPAAAPQTRPMIVAPVPQALPALTPQTGPKVAAPAASSTPPVLPPASPQPAVATPVSLPAGSQPQVTGVSINETKNCPVCRSSIKLEARICRFCGAKFDLARIGYCQNCHAVRDADENGQCTVCGSAVVDVHVRSRLIDQQLPVNVPVTQAPRSPRKSSGSKLGTIIALCAVLIGACLIIGILARPKISAFLATDTPRPTRTPSPTRTQTATPTQTPTHTSTPMPVEVTFDTIGDYPTGTRVSMTGVLVFFSSTHCGYECGLLLAEYLNSPKKITIFVRVAEAGAEPVPNQMKALPESYGQWDIRVRLNNGDYALVGQRITVTGRVTETTSGNPAISDITRIDLTP